jgi:hypothetical protein
MKNLLAALVLCMGTTVVAQQQQESPRQERRQVGTGIDATEVLPGLSGATQHQELPEGTFEKAQAFNLQGTVQETQRDGVTISREGLPAAELKVHPRTVVTLDGTQVATPDAIPEGSQVRAMFQLLDDDAVAVELQATSPKGKQGGGQKQQQR